MPEEDKLKYQFLKAEDILEDRTSEIKEEISSVEEKPKEIPIFEYKEKIELEEKPPKFNFSKIIPIFGILFILITLGGLGYLLYPKITSIIKEKQKSPVEEKIVEETQKTQENQVTLNIPTTTQQTTITLPTISETSTSQLEIPQITTSIETKTVEELKTSTSQFTFITTTQTYTPSSFISVPSKSINIVLDDLSNFENKLKEFLSKQEQEGTLIRANFIYLNQKMPVDTIYSYFIKNKDIKSFIDNYEFFIYYGYTRKYPIIVFKINDSEKVKNINLSWEKKGMANDLKTLFLGVNPGNPLSKTFSSKNYQNYEYRIINFPNNYVIIWSLPKDYLIYTSNEKGIKIILSNIK